jgi:hemerythrin
MLEWSEKYEIGDPLIDAQHRMLVSYVNRLDEMAAAAGADREQIELFLRFLDFLESYILTHFGHEEECMYRTRCPMHQENLKAHGEFLDFFRQFKRQVEVEGWRLEQVRELSLSCNTWIVRHILRVDIRLKDAREAAQKKTASEAQ